MARVIAPNMPHHIVQRGHNREVVFLEEADYQYYLETLKEWRRALAIKVYAWCLMTNHVHLVLEPGTDTSSIGLLMKRLAGRQTRYVNKQERRTGSLWEGRYKSSIIETDSYLLQCCRYVELNPVKARMVVQAEDYPWSSYRAKVGLEDNELLDFDVMYQSLGNHSEDYRRFVEAGIDSKEQEFIQQRLESNTLTGSSAFVDEIESRVGVRLEYRKPGRPNK